MAIGYAFAAGTLDRRITLMRETVSYNSLGEPVEAYEDFSEVWARVRFDSVGEQFTDDAIRAKKFVGFVIRYRTDITEKDRIRFDGKQYRIVGVTELGRRKGLELSTEFVEGAA